MKPADNLRPSPFLGNGLSLVLPAIVFAGSVTSILALDNTRDGWIALAAFTAPAVISILLSRAFLSTRKTVSHLLYGFGLLLLVAFVALVGRNSTDWLDVVSKGSVSFVVLVIWGATSLLALFAGTFLVLEARGRSEPGLGEDLEPPDLDFIRQGFSNIKGSFKEVQDVIRKETSAIDDATREFHAGLADQKKRFDKLRQQIAEARKEIERHRVLLHLTREQRAALAQLFSRYRSLDYLIAFVLGVLSSGLVQLLAYVGPKLVE